MEVVYDFRDGLRDCDFIAGAEAYKQIAAADAGEFRYVGLDFGPTVACGASMPVY